MRVIENNNNIKERLVQSVGGLTNKRLTFQLLKNFICFEFRPSVCDC